MKTINQNKQITWELLKLVLLCNHSHWTYYLSLSTIKPVGIVGSAALF